MKIMYLIEYRINLHWFMFDLHMNFDRSCTVFDNHNRDFLTRYSSDPTTLR